MTTASHLERTFAWGTTDNGVFGAKLMWNQLPELQALAGELPEFAGLTTPQLLERLFGGVGETEYIWVSRGDKVRQAVSLWKALQTRRWRAAGARNDRAQPEYRFEGIHHLVAAAGVRRSRLAGFLLRARPRAAGDQLRG